MARCRTHAAKPHTSVCVPLTPNSASTCSGALHHDQQLSAGLANTDMVEVAHLKNRTLAMSHMHYMLSASAFVLVLALGTPGIQAWSST